MPPEAAEEATVTEEVAKENSLPRWEPQGGMHEYGRDMNHTCTPYPFGTERAHG